MIDTPSISFEDLFGVSAADVTLDQLDSLLEECSRKSSDSLNQPENELVKVVDQGVVRWLTAEQAREALSAAKDAKDDSLKQSLQFALKGDARLLAMESQVLFVLAQSALRRYEKDQLIPKEEIQRAEPNFARLGRAVTYTLAELRGIERRIDETRKRNPLIGAFELKMSQLLTYQKDGRADQALELARELASMKQKYVMLSRGMQSDVNEARLQRLEVQRNKKSVLSWHRYLAAQREGVLLEENAQIKKSIENMRAVLSRTVIEKQEKFAHQMQFRNNQLIRNESELTAVQQEIEHLKRKENEAASVIEHLETQI